jgi:pimeloyl-ACP methyl ester carboxylesterase
MRSDPYEAGMLVAKQLQALDGPNVNPLCRTRVYTHSRSTERVLLLLHGFTNCPQQFDALGRQFHDQGWNVLIPRYPRHGYMDRLNTTISELRSDQLIALANQSANAAAGLGKHLTVAGLSLGGVLTGHLAQTHDKVERAVLIAPMFGLKRIPGPAHSVLTRLAYLLPNFYLWWDDKQKEQLGPPHAYPRLATHAYAALFRTAAGVLKAARAGAPKAQEITVITNASEPGLENRFTYQLVEAWRRRDAVVKTFEFPASDRLPHDLIDPANPDQNIELVYPVVSSMIAGDA